MGHLTNMRSTIKIKSTVPPSLVSPDKDIVRITDIDHLELARQLTLLEYSIFQRIEVRKLPYSVLYLTAI